MKHFLNWLAVTVNPRYWLQNYRQSTAWDAEMRRLIDGRAPFSRTGRYTAKIGSHHVWVENYPYAAFTLHDPEHKLMPTRRTVRLAARHFGLAQFAPREAAMEQYLKGAVN